MTKDKPTSRKLRQKSNLKLSNLIDKLAAEWSSEDEFLNDPTYQPDLDSRKNSFVPVNILGKSTTFYNMYR